MDILRAFYDWIAQFDPVDIFAVIVFALFWFWLYRTSTRPNNTFTIVDMFTDPYTNKASGAATVYIFFAGLSAWYIVRTVTHGGDAFNAIMGILTIFIVKAGADRAISAWGNRRPDMAPPPDSPPDKGAGDDDDDPCKLPKGLK